MTYSIDYHLSLGEETRKDRAMTDIEPRIIGSESHCERNSIRTLPFAGVCVHIKLHSL